MTIRVALHHCTRYRYDQPVALSPHEIRLRPAAHCRTPIHSYSLRVKPEKQFLNWQQDAYGNYLARLVFPEKTRELEITVDLVADMTVINPFDFFVEEYAEHYPFEYRPQLARELNPFLERETPGPLLAAWIADFRAHHLKPGINTTDLLVALNHKLSQDVSYLIRMEPGVQTPEETLASGSGSCRDSAWMLCQIVRDLGLASRFASGYLIQLTADVKALDGPSGPAADFTDLHAWTEVYLPGAGWVGLDPTSGLLAGEGHIPLACTAVPSSAAPVVGFTDSSASHFHFEMKVTRVHEDPRVTKPFREEEWQAIAAMGERVDGELQQADVRLTMGGEPTFVSIDDMEGAEWTTQAHGEKKLELAGILQRRLKEQFAPSGLLHFGQGKWYPGEPLPRWALGIYWRTDGVALWNDEALVAPSGAAGRETADAKRLVEALARRLGVSERYVIPVYEDVRVAIGEEESLPANVDPLQHDVKDEAARSRLARLLDRGLAEPRGFVLPLKPVDRSVAKAALKPSESLWRSSRWPIKREHVYLVAGDSPVGLRLPLASLPWVAPADTEIEYPVDPFAEREALGNPHAESAAATLPTAGTAKDDPKPKEVIHTALCTEARNGVVYVFMPPITHLEDYINLVAAVEQSAAALALPLRLEGYPPPRDPRIRVLNVTPDPGVIEVNVHPAASWAELCANVSTLYEEARQSRLGTEKFMLDGRHTGTGGGNHVTLGGPTPGDSPLLRRPDLLKSLITYWQNHPALSYLFSGMFIGPTSQAPRVDEARDDNLYELEIAFQQMTEKLTPGIPSNQPWLVDRLLRNLLVDLTGNTHRAEFSIDKLYSPDGPTGRLGLLEFRAFEMPPHPRMSLLQMLLLRALVARFWREPYQGRLVNWGTQLHDRFMLQHVVEHDLHDVVRDLRAAGYDFEPEWFAPFVEFRFPRYGTVVYEGVQVELRQAIEPWNVLGEEVSQGGTARYVDSSLERLQVKVNGMTDTRHIVACNGRPVPLHPTGTHGEYVAGVRYRAWAPFSALHPTISVHSPLVFDIVDTWSSRAIGGCTYHVVHPGGRSYDTFPVNANEAEARRVARFWDHGHTPGPMKVKEEPLNRLFPFTLDLRRKPVP